MASLEDMKVKVVFEGELCELQRDAIKELIDAAIEQAAPAITRATLEAFRAAQAQRPMSPR